MDIHCAASKGATLNFNGSGSGADSYCDSTGLKRRANYIPALGDNLKTLESLGEEGEGSDTSQLDEKIIRVEAGLSALNKRLVVVENNFSSLESVALEGLDEVKSNLA
uniref:Uncharacterized protein n=1 Tax=Solanum tuberosum TaxID=4113 RepID=M1DCF4_SOLTU